MFVNYMFERGSRTVGESLRPLTTARMLGGIGAIPLRELNVDTTISLYASIVRRSERVRREIRDFDERLPPRRRSTVLFSG